MRASRSAAALAGILAFAGAAPAEQTVGLPDVRLYVLDCGTLKERDGVPYGFTREQLPPRDLSNPCALVVHPRGTMLWETGLHESVNRTPPSPEPPRPGRPRPGDRVERTLAEQLRAIGYGPHDVTYLALSHSHWDHTGNVRDYLGSVWLVQRAERDAMFSASRSPNFSDVEGLAGSRTEQLEGDHDVFGDGTVVLLATPGHTPGHQSLLVRLRNTGAVILSGDLYHFPEELTSKAAAGRGSESVNASKARIQELLEVTGARLWIQHDVLGYRNLRKSPAFYD